MGKNTFFKIRVLSVLFLLLVVLFYLGIHWFDPQVLDIRRLRYVAKSNQDIKTLKPCQGKINAKFFEDDWEMIFDYRICNNHELSLSGKKLYYFLKFTAIGTDSIVAEGLKVFESEHGIPKPSYIKDFPIRIEGKIVCDTIRAKSYEENTFGEEIEGKILMPLSNNRIFKGIFMGSGKNCNGALTLKRINKNNLRSQYEKFYK